MAREIVTEYGPQLLNKMSSAVYVLMVCFLHFLNFIKPVLEVHASSATSQQTLEISCDSIRGPTTSGFATQGFCDLGILCTFAEQIVACGQLFGSELGINTGAIHDGCVARFLK